MITECTTKGCRNNYISHAHYLCRICYSLHLKELENQKLKQENETMKSALEDINEALVIMQVRYDMALEEIQKLKQEKTIMVAALELISGSANVYEDIARKALEKIGSK